MVYELLHKKDVPIDEEIIYNVSKKKFLQSIVFSNLTFGGGVKMIIETMHKIPASPLNNLETLVKYCGTPPKASFFVSEQFSHGKLHTIYND